MSIRVAIVMFQGVEDLDLVGPLSILKKANDLLGPGHRFDVCLTAANTGAKIKTALGVGYPAVRFEPGLLLAADAVVIPGGGSASDCDLDEAFSTALRDRVHQGKLCVSVCSGGLLLARCGAADARKIAIHANRRQQLLKLAECIPCSGVVSDWPIVSVGGDLGQGHLKGITAGFLLLDLFAPHTLDAVRKRLELSEVLTLSQEYGLDARRYH